MESTGVLVDADGFTAIYDRHARDLFRFCARRVAWLYGIAVNLRRPWRGGDTR
jgi:hypothetical protein